MLRTEERGEPEFFRFAGRGDGMFESAVDRCGMHHEADAGSLQVLGPEFIHLIKTGQKPSFCPWTCADYIAYDHE